jgi:hypothetical protein
VVRWTANIALFLGAEVVYVGLLAAAVRAGPINALTALAVAVVFTFPFLPIYLSLLTRLPERLTKRQKRAAAIAISPLLITPFILFSFAGGFAVPLLILALPGAMAYGALVRLPRQRNDLGTIAPSQGPSIS